MRNPGRRVGRFGTRAAVAGAILGLVLAYLETAPPALGGSRAESGWAQGSAGAGAETEVEVWIRRAHGLAEQGASKAAFDMLLDRGRARLDSGEISESINLFRAATDLAPEAAAGWGLLGRAYTRDRDFGAAREALVKAVDLGDASVLTLVFLGAVEWENGDLAAAEVTYRRALEANRGNALAWAQLGRLMLWQGRYAEAADGLDAALGAGASTPDVLFDRAEALRGADRFEEAIDAYRRVNLVAPTLFKAYYGLAVVLARAGLTEESRTEFARYESLYREDQERTRLEERYKGEMERARALLKAGDTEAAMDHLDRLPQTADVLSLTARGRFLAGETGAAIAALERAVSLDPGRSDLRRLLTEMRMALARDER